MVLIDLIKNIVGRTGIHLRIRARCNIHLARGIIGWKDVTFDAFLLIVVHSSQICSQYFRK